MEALLTGADSDTASESLKTWLVGEAVGEAGTST